jgi:hypothetical protein
VKTFSALVGASSLTLAASIKASCSQLTTTHKGLRQFEEMSHGKVMSCPVGNYCHYKCQWATGPEQLFLAKYTQCSGMIVKPLDDVYSLLSRLE